MVELDCERRIAEMEKSFEAFLEFQASPAYQTFLQWSERLGSLEAPSELQLTATENAISDGDTAWMLMATTLVLFMTIPGQTIFFAGMVRTENVLATAMEVFSITCLMTILWQVFGYSLALCPATTDASSSGIIGDFSRVFFQGMSMTSIHQLAPTIPEPVYAAYQLTFAVATPTLMCGSFAERMKYFPCLIFMGLWLITVYCPVAHAIWHPDGFLYKMDIMDLAGGLVVHLNAGIGSLMCVKVIGNRRLHDNNFSSKGHEPHNILFTVLGCCMMWVAWFGFNAGSALQANGYATNILLVTQISASVSAFSWMFVEWYSRGTPSVLGMVNGGVAGLICITPAAGFVGPLGAFVIGLLGGAACYKGTQIKHYYGFDDAIDAFGVNTTGGIVGTLLTGIFATSSFGPRDGLLTNASVAAGFHRLAVQFYGICFVIAWSGCVSLFWLLILDNTFGLRVTAKQERLGLDEALHAETLLHRNENDRKKSSILDILKYQSFSNYSMHGASVHGAPSNNFMSSNSVREGFNNEINSSSATSYIPPTLPYFLNNSRSQRNSLDALAEEDSEEPPACIPNSLSIMNQNNNH